jgi:hypothetical protein
MSGGFGPDAESDLGQLHKKARPHRGDGLFAAVSEQAPGSGHSLHEANDLLRFPRFLYQVIVEKFRRFPP